MSSVSHPSELLKPKEYWENSQICSQLCQAEVPIAWGPHLQLPSELRAVTGDIPL